LYVGEEVKTMRSPDFIRGLMISLCALVLGALVAGTWQAWRQRYVPVQKRMPVEVVVLFAVGYGLLIMQVAVERWFNLGSPTISIMTITGFFALLVNFVALVLAVRTREVEFRRYPLLNEAADEHREAVKEFRHALATLYRLNMTHWQSLHPGKRPPEPVRYQDELLRLDEEALGDLLEKANGEDKPE
jgi:branched-subunit amino acid ABC-type transport system permease component